MPTLKEMILTAPDSQMDSSLKPLIEKWDEEPTALQILEPLDHMIHGSMASGLVVTLFQSLYNKALEREGKTHKDLEPLATWRN